MYNGPLTMDEWFGFYIVMVSYTQSSTTYVGVTDILFLKTEQVIGESRQIIFLMV